MVLPLSSINTGGSAKILALANPPLMAGRLSDLGFEPDEVITCVIKGKKDGMSAYLVKHAVIALRQRDASGILVRIQ